MLVVATVFRRRPPLGGGQLGDVVEGAAGDTVDRR
jgi:hypothetical protein